MNNKLSVSSSPHIRSAAATNRIMLDVILALMPATVAGCIIFGWRALLVVSVCAASAVLSEFLFNLIVKKEQTISDLSAALTGLLLGLNLHANAPIWQCVIGAAFAIIVVKCLFGGLGCNFANPAITARVFLLVCFTDALGGGAIPKFSSAPELISGATPLEILKNGGELPSLLDMVLGLRGGAIGETCSLALIVGFIYLVVRRVINFETPLIFVGTVFVLSLIFDSSLFNATYNIFSGGLILGAVFMATDYVTTPVTRSGKMIFAFGCGIITFFIRYFGSYPEGVSYAILFMNIISPYIESWTKNFALGGKKA
ncbi:MAG: RnfABCDGE type electron transport complex subunit D [Ruminococcaceae bacterium]|nr:RnfABCDGE type electron transport complex subunit D [Oscillospiraceae bacterium]